MRRTAPEQPTHRRAANAQGLGAIRTGLVVSSWGLNFRAASSTSAAGGFRKSSCGKSREANTSCAGGPGGAWLGHLDAVLRDERALMSDNDAQGCVWGIGWLGLMAWLLWPGSGDHLSDSLWWAVKYGVGYSQVHISAKPADCDFLHAPLGIKGCSFKSRVIAYTQLETSWAETMHRNMAMIPRREDQ
jgi:hypothetical protein